MSKRSASRVVHINAQVLFGTWQSSTSGHIRKQGYITMEEGALFSNQTRFQNFSLEVFFWTAF